MAAQEAAQLVATVAEKLPKAMLSQLVDCLATHEGTSGRDFGPAVTRLAVMQVTEARYRRSAVALQPLSFPNGELLNVLFVPRGLGIA